MSLTLGLTGMDQATEVALKAAFLDAHEHTGHWALVGEGEADYVIVDMDSMYGPMSWLRLHAAGKKIIGLTSAPRTQADFLLGRPFDAEALAAVLAAISGIPVAGSAAPTPDVRPDTPVSVAAPPPVPPVDAPPAPVPVTVAPAAATAPPPAPRPAPAPAPVVPAPAVPAAPAAVAIAPAQPAAPRPVAPAAAPPAPVAAQAPMQAPVQMEEPAGQPLRNTAFVHWLRPGALTGRARYQVGNGPAVFIDFSQRLYYGPATLKPLAEYFVANVGLRDFEQLDDATWQSAITKLGAPLPLVRLQWLGGLLAGEGKLLPGFNPEGRFVLNKWPETEREYPRHFRIATAMMKGPSTIAEIAAASSVPAADVIDFINANIATGFAEQAGATAATESGKSGGLLDRLRGR